MERLDRFTRLAVALAAAASVACLALLGTRFALAREDALGWLAWNLFLAWIPLAAALAASRAPTSGPWRALRASLLAGWLLFLPNAPYLITDLIHLPGRTPAALSIDIPLFGAFAATGLLIFLVCLRVVHRRALARTAPGPAWALVLACVWLASAGIYLGRVLRWNSWDLIGDPTRQVAELAAHLGDPSRLAVAVGFTAVAAILLSLAYSGFHGAGASRRRTRSR